MATAVQTPLLPGIQAMGARFARFLSMPWEARVAAHVAVADLSVKAGEPAHDIDLSTAPQD